MKCSFLRVSSFSENNNIQMHILTCLLRNPARIVMVAGRLRLIPADTQHLRKDNFKKGNFMTKVFRVIASQKS